MKIKKIRTKALDSHRNARNGWEKGTVCKNCTKCDRVYVGTTESTECFKCAYSDIVNIIFNGPPRTGKTYISKLLTERLQAEGLAPKVFSFEENAVERISKDLDYFTELYTDEQKYFDDARLKTTPFKYLARRMNVFDRFARSGHTNSYLQHIIVNQHDINIFTDYMSPLEILRLCKGIGKNILVELKHNECSFYSHPGKYLQRALSSVEKITYTIEYGKEPTELLDQLVDLCKG